jgi:hypothetical protein
MTAPTIRIKGVEQVIVDLQWSINPEVPTLIPVVIVEPKEEPME